MMERIGTAIVWLYAHTVKQVFRVLFWVLGAK